MSEPRKTIRVIVTKSLTRPGLLSMRIDPADPTGTPIYQAITERFKEGDVLEIRLAPRRRK